MNRKKQYFQCTSWQMTHSTYYKADNFLSKHQMFNTRYSVSLQSNYIQKNNKIVK